MDLRPIVRQLILALLRQEEGSSAGVADRLIVDIGVDLLQIVPGRVSTEVDAHLSHDTQATIEKAHRIVGLYKERGIDTSRIYIKVASTWAGVQACKALEAEGINCNCTLIFSFAQARTSWHFSRQSPIRHVLRSAVWLRECTKPHDKAVRRSTVLLPLDVACAHVWLWM